MNPIYPYENPQVALEWARSLQGGGTPPHTMFAHWDATVGRKQLASLRSALRHHPNTRIELVSDSPQPWAPVTPVPKGTPPGTPQHRANHIRAHRLAQEPPGAVWFDLDVLWLRPIGPLLKAYPGPWLYAWERQPCPNNAVAASGPGWAGVIERMDAANRYDTRQLPYDGDPSFPVRPCAWFDQGWFDGSFKSFFKSGTPTPDPRAFAHHWHNQWDAAIEQGSPFALLEP